MAPNTASECKEGGILGAKAGESDTAGLVAVCWALAGFSHYSAASTLRLAVWWYTVLLLWYSLFPSLIDTAGSRPAVMYSDHASICCDIHSSSKGLCRRVLCYVVQYKKASISSLRDC